MSAAMPQDLFLAAQTARANAYAPYSAFHVGAAIRVDDGIVSGANVENASYGLSCCAERSAVFAAASRGLREVTEVLVLAQSIGGNFVSPCGACRQVLSEFAAPRTPVWLADPEGNSVQTTVGDLLPGAFGKGDLGK